LTIELDPNIPIPAAENPVRYGKLPEIHHIFRSDPKSPNVTISGFFLLAVVAAFSPLFGAVSIGKASGILYVANPS
jgi:oligosaccharyltransferase complex subunit delta (ribophorin II)